MMIIYLTASILYKVATINMKKEKRTKVHTNKYTDNKVCKLFAFT